MFKSSSPFISVLVLLFLTSTFNRFLCFWAESHHRVWFHLIDLSHWGQDIDERISFRDLFPIFFGCISETKSKKDIPSQIKKILLLQYPPITVLYWQNVKDLYERIQVGSQPQTLNCICKMTVFSSFVLIGQF